ncbi:MAG: ATP-dependent DNA ligase [Candidatus Omnitrophota bacterium]|nr:MAG: ATP-dependent DNA ligase [Candidatus Omnitrophota bacterium]
MRAKPIFVVHKHQAKHLHYDFRLEKDGTLKSWAIPKGPTSQEGIKRLAVQVQDHSLGYADFEGQIPEGLYGAGKVEIWDKGYYMPITFEPNKLIFRLEGEKLKGTYCLIKLKTVDPNDKNWLFFRRKGK